MEPSIPNIYPEKNWVVNWTSVRKLKKFTTCILAGKVSPGNNLNANGRVTSWLMKNKLDLGYRNIWQFLQLCARFEAIKNFFDVQKFCWYETDVVNKMHLQQIVGIVKKLNP